MISQDRLWISFIASLLTETPPFYPTEPVVQNATDRDPLPRRERNEAS
jgi:hypothetical protein